MSEAVSNAGRSSGQEERDSIAVPAVAGVLCGLLAGLGLATVLLLFNPVVLQDSLLDLLLGLLLLPAVAGLAAALGLAAPARLFGGGRGGRTVAGLPAVLWVLLPAAFLIIGLLPALAFQLLSGPAASLLLVEGAFAAAGLLFTWLLCRRVSSRSAPLRSLGRLVLLAAALFLVVLAFSAAFLAPPRSLAGNGLELLVVGLDGVSPVIADPLMTSGEMPALARLVREGTYGDLTSIEPMFSPAVWATLSTGLLPERHGVTDFLKASYTDIRARSIWEIVGDLGGRTAVYEWLGTWPPPVIEGFVVPGWLARTPATYPAELGFIKRLKMAGTGDTSVSPLALSRDALAAIRHGLRLSTLRRLGFLFLQDKLFHPSRVEIHYQKYWLAMALDEDVFEFLLAREKPRYAFYYHQALDPISHNYWKYYEPEGFPEVTPEEQGLFGRVIPDSYREADRQLGRLLGRLGPETTVFVVSDHGFQSVARVPQYAGMKVVVHAEALLERLGLGPHLEGFHTNANLFLNARSAGDEEADRLLRQAEERVAAFRVAEVDKPLFLVERIDHPGEAADFLQVALNSGLIEDYRAGRITFERSLIRYPGGECLLHELVQEQGVSGTHHLSGIIAAAGPAIRQGVRLPPGSASVLDLTPTLLALLDLPIGRDMDGKVLLDLFRPERVSAEKLRWIDSYGQEKLPLASGAEAAGGEKELREKLKALGYMG